MMSEIKKPTPYNSLQPGDMLLSMFGRKQMFIIKNDLVKERLLVLKVFFNDEYDDSLINVIFYTYSGSDCINGPWRYMFKFQDS